MLVEAKIAYPAPDQGLFYRDVVNGLSAYPKRLDAKYFYDAEGNLLFQRIMHSPEYYPTKCEMEIFVEQKSIIAAAVTLAGGAFDLIELGAGDATKSIHLLAELVTSGADFIYKPVAISGSMIKHLKDTLPREIPGLQMQGLEGEYLEMLRTEAESSSLRKVVLFLGSNIGNMDNRVALDFLKEVRAALNKGDLLLVGIDLVKDPDTIRAAYNDKAGITRQFNLNLLKRINRELQADFEVSAFKHFPTYDPLSGACKSYLVSTRDQVVTIGAHQIEFKKHEAIDMEISQKFTPEQTRYMAYFSGFKPVQEFFDRQGWFLDGLWLAD